MTRAVRPLLGVYSAHRNSEGSAQLVGAYVSLLVRARRCVVARRLQWLIQGVFEYFGVGRADASLLGLSRVADEWKSTHDSYLQWQQRSNSGGFAEVLSRSLTPSDFYKGPAKSRGMLGYNPRSPPLPVLAERPMSIFGCPPSARTLLSAYNDSRASVDRFRQRGHGSIILHDEVGGG